MKPSPPPGIPFIELGHPELGPRALIVANIHGDEALGTSALHVLTEMLATTTIRGSVGIVATLNPGGLRKAQRGFGQEAWDLNRCFPGKAQGNEAERHAAAVWAWILAMKPDFLLDLHSDCAGHLPHAILDRSIAARAEGLPELERRCLRLAQASGLTVVWDHSPELYRAHKLDHSLSGALLNHGRIPAITLEVGPRRFVDPLAEEDALSSILSILADQGLISGSSHTHPSRIPGIWRRMPGPRPARAGFLRPRFPPGRWLPAGTCIAELRSLDGRLLERLCISEPAWILALHETAWLGAGVPCAALAVSED